MSDARLPDAYLSPGSSSFAEFIGAVSPELLPSRGVPCRPEALLTWRRTRPPSWRRPSRAAW